jgi:hypothetical protein
VTADRGTPDISDQQLVSGLPTRSWALVFSTVAFDDLPQLSNPVFDDSGPKIIGSYLSSCD